MEKFRKLGNAPFRVAVIHGGPGAAGDAAPIARKLGETRGVQEVVCSLPRTSDAKMPIAAITAHVIKAA